ncbi:hypothetical protein QM588_22315 [Rhodococcus sp. IEGM 1354]|uniref:hypothetical protein n=1 Tax=Rhodococcus sp. IEGM 1354 TaxID=3047088 RepID=UPI0024B6F6A2|nr:hypothetical protein [Rhodococcus sp. IEGM 1354]MDI9933162.1 hypothetical protein [Rhodococcus sp. IEGM 1354]
MSVPEVQGVEYANHIQAALDAEYQRRDNFNSRAATVITSAVGLVSLTLVVYALVLGKDFKLSGAELYCMMAALVFLLLCAASGVLAGMSWSYDVAPASTLRDMITTRWMDDEVDARNCVAKTNIDTIESLRSGSTTKHRFLFTAYILQTVAIGALGLSAVFVFT